MPMYRKLSVDIQGDRMKFKFIVNPAAGKGKKAEELKEKIGALCKETDADCELYLTTCVGDASGKGCTNKCTM